MHNYDNKYPAQLGFEPATSRFQAPVYTNQPSGPTQLYRNLFDNIHLNYLKTNIG